MKWAIENLGSLGIFKNGVNFKKESVGEGRPFINVKDITSSRYFTHEALDRVKLNVHEDALARQEDLFFVRSSVKLDGIALVGQLRNGLPEQGVLHCGFIIRFRPDQSRVTTDFLMYLLLTPLFRQKLKNLSNGAAIVNISQAALKSLVVPIPPLSDQDRIASVLSTYDDLIENNRRRIQLLEQAARLLYKEWFVHLRFPGHEHTKITDGVPEGWEKKPFARLADFLNGYAFKPSDWEGSGIPIVKIPELRNGPTTKTPRNSGENIPAKYLLEDGDILFSWSGTLLVNIWNFGKGFLNQHLFNVKPVSPDLRSFVYLSLKEALIEFQNETTGATMKHIRKSALEKVAPLVPKASILRNFESALSPILEQIGILQRQTIQASLARDLLLPKLMNGEVAV